MKLLVALNNNNIEKRIIEKYSVSYDIYILTRIEEVINKIDKESDFLIIIREDIKGNIDFIDFIDIVKKINSKVRIIVITKKLTEEKKEKLFSKEIFNIIEGDKFLFSELEESIENPKMVIYKAKEKKKSNVLIVSGVKASGKTFFCRILSELISKDKKKKVLVLDLNVIHPTIDLYVKCKKNYSLKDLIKDFQNNTLKEISCYESENLKYNNLKYIINSTAIPFPDIDTIVGIVEYLKSLYDFIIIDTSSTIVNQMYSIATKINANVIYIIEPNIKAIREYKIDTLYVPKESIEKTLFIINKYKRNLDIVKQIKKYVNIYGRIGYSYFSELYINKDIKIFLKLNISKLLRVVGITRFQKIKLKIMEKLFNMEEE